MPSIRSQPLHYYIIWPAIPFAPAGDVGTLINDAAARELLTQVPFWDRIVIVGPQAVPHQITSPQLVDNPKVQFFSLGRFVSGSSIISKLLLTVRYLISSLPRLMALFRHPGYFEFSGSAAWPYCVAWFVGKKRIFAPDGPVAMSSYQFRDARGSGWLFAIQQVYNAWNLTIRGFMIRTSPVILSVGRGLMDEVGITNISNVLFVISAPVAAEEIISLETIRERVFASRNDLLRVVCNDRFASEKAVDTLIEAMYLLREKDLPIHLDLRGGGPLEDKLRAMVQERGLASVVRFYGRQPYAEVQRAIGAADVLVNLTRVLDVNRTAFEGAACGCPLVLSNLAGPRTFLKTGIVHCWLIQTVHQR